MAYRGTVRKDGNTASRGNKRGFTEMIAGTNGHAYVQTVLDPFSGSGARVPDIASYPTNTTTVQLEYTQTALAPSTGTSYCTGGALLLNSGYCSYCPELATGNSLGTSDSGIVYVAPGGGGSAAQNTYSFADPSASASLNKSNTGSTGINNVSIPGSDSMQTAYAATRLVAAGLKVEYIGNDQTNQGLITCCQVTELDVCQYYDLYLKQSGTQAFVNWTNTAGVITTSPVGIYTPVFNQSKMENFRGNYSGPAKDGCKVNYTPLDDDDLNMGNMVSTNTTYPTPAYSYNTYGGNQTRVSSVNNFTQQNLGLLQWHAQGIASTAQFRVYVMLHFEGIPQTDNMTYEKPISAPEDKGATATTGVMAVISQGAKFIGNHAGEIARFGNMVYQCTLGDPKQCAAILDTVAKNGPAIAKTLTEGGTATEAWKNNVVLDAKGRAPRPGAKGWSPHMNSLYDYGY